ncbi:hypothetical protein JG688_00012831 [Phytophthora aleatoria]|uniref:DUF6818 domain-containing protein n=1 Tax=Phytophthora aleatoria TaxID=2496075 RepID=A0A8J5J2G3_9STRA|nr:hypothetical protein JG688_00012831 [Phytophthora aleatoria]
MPQTHGSRNYNPSEQQHLLNTIADRLPLHKPDWDAVAAMYNAKKEKGWTERSAVSLSRKFTGLCSAASLHFDGMNRMERAAPEMKRKISKHVKNARTPSQARGWRHAQLRGPGTVRCERDAAVLQPAIRTQKTPPRLALLGLMTLSNNSFYLWSQIASRTQQRPVIMMHKDLYSRERWKGMSTARWCASFYGFIVEMNSTLTPGGSYNCSRKMRSAQQPVDIENFWTALQH